MRKNKEKREVANDVLMGRNSTISTQTKQSKRGGGDVVFTLNDGINRIFTALQDTLDVTVQNMTRMIDMHLVETNDIFNRHPQ